MLKKIWIPDALYFWWPLITAIMGIVSFGYHGGWFSCALGCLLFAYTTYIFALRCGHVNLCVVILLTVVSGWIGEALRINGN